MRFEEPQRSVKVDDWDETRRDAYLRLPRLSPRTRDERGRESPLLFKREAERLAGTFGSGIDSD